jgi:phospholipase C
LQCAGMSAFKAEVRSDGAELSLTLVNTSVVAVQVELADESYGDRLNPVSLEPGRTQQVKISTQAGKQWYDLSATANGTQYRFAGRIETGAWSVSDPAMA